MVLSCSLSRLGFSYNYGVENNLESTKFCLFFLLFLAFLHKALVSLTFRILEKIQIIKVTISWKCAHTKVVSLPF